MGARALRYLGFLPGSIRLDAQLFADSWGRRAITLEPSLHWKQSESRLLSAYLRAYKQGSADFWERTYMVDEAGQLPRWRTLDRNLSSYYTLTAGGRFQWQGETMSAYLDASVMDTRYANYIFLDSRLALTGQTGFRYRF